MATCPKLQFMNNMNERNQRGPLKIWHKNCVKIKLFAALKVKNVTYTLDWKMDMTMCYKLQSVMNDRNEGTQRSQLATRHKLVSKSNCAAFPVRNVSE